MKYAELLKLKEDFEKDELSEESIQVFKDFIKNPDGKGYIILNPDGSIKEIVEEL